MECKPHDDPDKCEATFSSENPSKFFDELYERQKEHRKSEIKKIKNNFKKHGLLLFYYILFLINIIFISKNIIEVCGVFVVMILFSIWSILIDKLK